MIENIDWQLFLDVADVHSKTGVDLHVKRKAAIIKNQCFAKITIRCKCFLFNATSLSQCS